MVCSCILANVELNETNFPDAVFRSHLFMYCHCGDGVLTDEEIANIQFIVLPEKGIKSLKGVEYLTAMRNLECGDNQLTELDVSKNTALTYLDCSDNQLTALNVSGCKELGDLICSGNQLTTLDVSECAKLEWLSCKNNLLTELDVSGCSRLEDLSCQENSLTTLDVSTCSALKSMICNSNRLTALDLSKNTKLRYMLCSDNQLTTLKVSENSRMDYFAFDQNKIKGAEMDALLESLPSVTNHSTMNVIYCENEQNVMTKAQVAVAKAKGWKPLYYDGSGWQEYEGSNPTGIDEIKSEELRSFSSTKSIKNEGSIYDLQGRRLSGEPAHGIYIENGRKVAK